MFLSLKSDGDGSAIVRAGNTNICIPDTGCDPGILLISKPD